MGQGTNPAEVIVAAIQTEREASLFYRMMAELATDDSSRDRLSALADDETAHATTLAGLYHEMTGRGVTETAPASAEGPGAAMLRALSLLVHRRTAFPRHRTRRRPE